MTQTIISLKPFNNKVFYNNRIFRINDGHNVFFNIDTELLKQNIKIVTSDLAKHNKKFKKIHVYCDVPYPWDILNWLSILSHPHSNILFIFESPIINPFNHLNILKPLFKKIYSWSDNTFSIPQLFPKKKIMSRLSLAKKKTLVAVFSHKAPISLFRMLSPYRNELYTTRNRLISDMSESYPDKFDLYGRGWSGVQEIPQGKKLETISKYKFCLAIENCIAPGYITEKIFDCLFAGCVPVYLGAPNIQEFIPPQSFIDLRKFKDHHDLMTYLSALTMSEYRQYLLAGRKFVDNKLTQKKWAQGSIISELVRLNRRK